MKHIKCEIGNDLNETYDAEMKHVELKGLNFSRNQVLWCLYFYSTQDLRTSVSM